ncbi:stress response translation initiation inhibitor YciH [Bowmanella sp. JS7-9]|uniref:stress response translation initiation inhibitor YciH n=1 Tax=Alteromonadaceae TaxID=72275 RepID=UPI00103B71A6|nr:stress response translation initiation inhibitor YciH [Bowmanella sp. JS7-9]TBX22509.1 translation initiation factor Sui1 [Bowmanella sp. JS7-9]
MSNKDSVLVYSTGIGRIDTPAHSEPQRSGDGIARIRRETKGRKGKGVTTISGLLFSDAELKLLCAELKKQCGCGGSVKEGVIEIQGDNREKIQQVLEKKGIKSKLAGG